MFDGVIPPTKEYKQAQEEISYLIKDYVVERLDEEITWDTIDHPDDLVASKEDIKFLKTNLKDGVIFKGETSINELKLDLWFFFTYGELASLYLYKICYFIEIPFNIPRIYGIKNEGKYEFISENRNIENKLNNNEVFTNALGELVRSKGQIFQYEVKAEGIYKIIPKKKNSMAMMALAPTIDPKSKRLSLGITGFLNLTNSIVEFTT